MAGDILLKYGSSVAMTVTNLHSIATSSTNVAGWTSAGEDNITNCFEDYLISAQFTVDNAGAATAGKSIKVYAYAAFNDTPTWPDLFSAGTEGSQGTATVHDEEQRDCGMRLLWAGVVDAGTSEIYAMPPTSLALAFGGFVPSDWALFITQDTGQALESTGNAVYYQPVYHQYT
jgi:hypothetical protein